MADTFGPFDNANMGETGWSAIFDRLRGVLDGSHLVATASGVTARGVDLSPGTALHQGFHYTTDTSREVVSAANTSGSPRVDRVVARVDVAANTMLPVVIEGTPSGNPSPPSVASTDEPLWRWTVADGAGAVSSIVDERSVLAGLVTSGVRPLAPKPGHVHFESGRWLGWNGSSWVVLYQDSGWVTMSLSGALISRGGTPQARKTHTGFISLRGGVQKSDGTFILAGSSSGENIDPICTLPTGMRPSETFNVPAAASLAGSAQYGAARLDIHPDGLIHVAHDVDIAWVQLDGVHFWID